jgi:anti-sigma factor RsiW
MDCMDELTLSMLADGELSADEAAPVRAHLAECEACRTRARSFVVEAQSLRTALLGASDADAPATVPKAGTQVAWLAAAAAVVLGLSTGISLFQRLLLHGGFAWLGALSLQACLDVLAIAAPARPASLVAIMPLALALTLLTVLASSRVRRYAPAAVALTLLVAVGVAPASATEVRVPQRGQSAVVIPSTETIDDALVAFGDTIIVEGTVKGDVIAVGGQVRLSGSTSGSLICLARRLDLDGRVGGDAYVMVDSIGVRGHVDRNLHLAAKRADLVAGSTIARDIMAYAGDVRLAGVVGRDARTRTEATEFVGQVGRDARTTSGRVVVGASAQIAGDLVTEVARQQDVRVADGATIRGSRQFVDGSSGEARIHGPRYVPSVFVQASFYLWQALGLAAALITGAILFWLAPLWFDPRTPSPVGSLQALGVGFVVLVATPVAACVTALTLVGLPIAFIAAAGWVVIVYVLGLFTADWLGRIVLRSWTPGLRSFLLALLVGQVLLRLATHLPYVDWAVWLVALLMGAGLAAAALRRLWRHLRASPSAA